MSEELTVEKLKAAAYDTLVIIQNNQEHLAKLNKAIENKIKEESDKKEDKKK